MNKKTDKTYEDHPWDDSPETGDIVTLKGLPSPEEVAATISDRRRKVTLALGEDTVEFFKQYAEEYGVPYQKMIRNVLDAYCKQHQ